MPATIAAVILSLAISYFPYGRLQLSKIAPVSYVFYRSAPRMALDLEASQRNLDQILHQLLQSSAPQPFVCARDIPEAPNIRTVTYDFAYVNWVLPEAAPTGRSIWLFDQHGPDAQSRKRYQTWRQIAADDLWSLWEATSPQPLALIDPSALHHERILPNRSNVIKWISPWRTSLITSAPPPSSCERKRESSPDPRHSP
jgi:hypothetical protein